jgi:hypothetical protein
MVDEQVKDETTTGESPAPSDQGDGGGNGEATEEATTPSDE